MRKEVSVRSTTRPATSCRLSCRDPLLLRLPLLLPLIGDVPPVLGVSLEPAVEEEGIKFVARGDGRQPGEEVAEAGEGLGVVGLAGGDQAEENRRAAAARLC